MLNKHRKGFSLIELIVAIAILATMLLVLTPSVLKYIDESRTTKDLKTVADFTEVIESSLADDTAYNEITKFIIGKYKDSPLNYSSYIDHSEIEVEEYKESLGEDSYTYGEKARRADGIRYMVGGKMRGITITFPVTEDKKLDYHNGRINEIQPGGRQGSESTILLKDASPAMVDFIKSKFGKNIPIDSATYRFSELTVFIYTGPAVTDVETADAPMKVYSQWDGTNLIDVDRSTGTPNSAGGSDDDDETPSIPNNTVISPPNTSSDGTPIGVTGGSTINNNALYVRGIKPIGSECNDCGGYYWCSCEAVIYDRGDTIPTTPQQYDVYVYGDYIYMYQVSYGGGGCPYTLAINNKSYDGFYTSSGRNTWAVGVTNRQKTSYSESFVETIAGVKADNFMGTFEGCTRATSLPKVPIYATNIEYYAWDCNINAVEIPCALMSLNTSWGTHNDSINRVPYHYIGCGHSNTTSTAISAGSRVPDGCLYVRGITLDYDCTSCQAGSFTTWCYCDVTIYNPGDVMPNEPAKFDVFICGDYIYMYECAYGGGGCPYTFTINNNQYVGFYNSSVSEQWSVGAKSKIQTTYSDYFVESILGKPASNFSGTFDNCMAATNLPRIPTWATGSAEYVVFGNSDVSIQVPCQLTIPSSGYTTKVSHYHYEGCGHDHAAERPIPEGGIYITGIVPSYDGNAVSFTAENATVLSAGTTFPSTVNQYDMYIYGDYVYMYKAEYGEGCPYYLYVAGYNIEGFHTYCSTSDMLDGWTVGVLDRGKSSYGELLTEINGKTVNNFSHLFDDCLLIQTAPRIPITAQRMDGLCSIYYAYGDHPAQIKIEVPCTFKEEDIGSMWAGYDLYHVSSCTCNSLIRSASSTLEENSWETIHNIIEGGYARQVGWAVGDTKTLTVNGGQETATIIGMYTGTNSKVTFAIIDNNGIGVRAMNSNANTNSSGWGSTELRTWLNNEVYNSMTGVKDYIIDSYKDYIPSINGLSTSTDKLFLLSVSNAYLMDAPVDGGASADSIQPSLCDEGGTYTWFYYNQMPSGAWLRSANFNNSTTFFATSGPGALSSVSAQTTRTVCPAFVIG